MACCRSVRHYCTQFLVTCCAPCGRRWWTLQPHELPGCLPRERVAASPAAGSKAGGTNHAVADGGNVAGRRHGLGCGIGAGSSAIDSPMRCMVTDLGQTDASSNSGAASGGKQCNGTAGSKLYCRSTCPKVAESAGRHPRRWVVSPSCRELVTWNGTKATSQSGACGKQRTHTCRHWNF